MTSVRGIDQEYEIPGQEEARMASIEAANNIARSFRDAEARMATDPNYHLHIGDCGGFLLPSQIEELYETYPRPHPPDPEFDDFIAARDAANAEADADWEREREQSVTDLPPDFDHHNPDRYEPVPDGPTGAPDPDEPVVLIDEGGIEAHYEGGFLHRTDGPAVVYPDGSEEWYLAGLLHRDGGPAVTTADGSRYWYRGGDLHRENGPAVEESDGTRAWYRNGKLHRTDGPAIEGPFVSARWYLDGKRQSAHSR